MSARAFVAKGRTMRRVTWLAVLGGLILLGCATEPEPAEAPVEDAYHTGAGRDASFGRAMNEAKMDAVRAFVVDYLGESTERAHRPELDQILYGTRNPNAYVYTDTMETTREDNVGTLEEPEYVYEMRIKVDAGAIVRTLDSHGIEPGDAVADPERPEEEPSPDDEGIPEPGEAADELALHPDDWNGAAEEERRFIRRYVDRLTYMVYFPEDTELDRSFLRQAVGQANSYLISEGHVAVDASQVQRLREDQQMVYEEETGGEVGMLQWIAQRLDADVYVEVDGTVSADTRNDRHYATANMDLRMYETSTGQLLGSVPYQSPETVSRTDQRSAKSNAVQSAVYAAMPHMIDQSRELLARQFTQGIRYELVLQNTEDSRMVAEFRRQMRDRVSEVDTVSQSPEETEFVVYHYGSLDELEELTYQAADAVPGMEGLYQVMRRGKSITFNTGI